MKKVSRRSKTIIILAVLMVAGLLYFSADVLINGGKWSIHPGNGNIYSGGNLSTGMVRDRIGDILVYSGEDGRLYSDNPTVRTAMLHLTGDSYGYIPSIVLNEYGSEISGYDSINGVYSLNSDEAELKLTVSAKVSTVAYEALAGRKGCVGVYNYKTGEIICMTSSMSYDPMNMPDIGKDDSGMYDGVFVNRFISSTYVPGSIFKLVTTAAAIETIPDIFEQTFYCDGDVEVEGDTIVCAGVHGEIDFKTALSRSCNCAFASIASQVGADVLTEYANKALVNESLSFDGLTTAKGSFVLRDKTESNVAWAGIGQYTNLINPCSYMTFVGAIGNGGTVVYPHLLYSVTGGGVMDTEYGQTVTGDVVLNYDTCQTMKEMMRNNVLTVYGDPYDLNICAKSGTAEIGEGIEPHATYAGFLDDEEHPLAFIVIVENGGSGSAICGSIANEVLNEAVKMMDSE